MGWGVGDGYRHCFLAPRAFSPGGRKWFCQNSDIALPTPSKGGRKFGPCTEPGVTLQDPPRKKGGGQVSSKYVTPQGRTAPLSHPTGGALGNARASVNHPGAPHTPEEETETRAKPTVAPPKGHPTQNIQEEFGSVEQVVSGNPQHPTKRRKETLQTKQ